VAVEEGQVRIGHSDYLCSNLAELGWEEEEEAWRMMAPMVMTMMMMEGKER